MMHHRITDISWHKPLPPAQKERELTGFNEQEYRRRYYQKNKEKILELQKKYVAQNREKINARMREYRRRKKNDRKNDYGRT